MIEMVPYIELYFIRRYSEPYNRAIPTSVARPTLSQDVVKLVKQMSPKDMTVVVGVVASNHGWGLSIPYRSIHVVTALIQD